ncbi:MAG: hypothetical protein DI539_24570 [Flavobacterium psychrophilum]|nr:MAG: hypothetical protein DI539_24570 [Flavobacterium psychrophilum]
MPIDKSEIISKRIRMSGKTGEICQQSGVYKCSLHPTNEIPLSKGEKFPPCSKGGGHSATWILVRAA